MTSPSNEIVNMTWQEGELFTWHGAELLFIPLMMTTGIVGNVLVFYIYHFRWRSNTVTLIKRMLAALDLISLVLVYPALLYMTVRPHRNSFRATCVFTSVVALGTAMASGGVLIIIAVDRFMRLCLLRKTGVGTDTSRKLFAASIIFAVLINIPCGWTFNRSIIFIPRYRVQVSCCFFTSESSDKTIVLVYAASLGVVFLVVCSTLIVLYYNIVKTLRQLSFKHDELRYQSSITRRIETLRTQKQSDVMRSSSVVFIAVTVVFFASYIPYFVTLVLSLTETSSESFMTPTTKALYDLAKFSPLVNHMANPIIYSFTSDHFRAELKRMFTLTACKDGIFQRRVCSFNCKTNELSLSSISREEI